MKKAMETKIKESIREIGRSKKDFNDSDRKEAIQDIPQKKAYIYCRNKTIQKQLLKQLSVHNFKEDDMSYMLEWLQTDIKQKII